MEGGVCVSGRMDEWIDPHINNYLDLGLQYFIASLRIINCQFMQSGWDEGLSDCYFLAA